VPYKQVQEKDVLGNLAFFITKKGNKEKKMKEIDNPLFNPKLINTAEAMGIKNTGAPASTVISLKGMDFKLMMFEFAKALTQAKQEGKFATKKTQDETTVVLSTVNSVITVSGAGSTSRCSSLVVGGEWVDGDDDEITFEINHLEGPGED
jgi:hypothetical protein